MRNKRWAKISKYICIGSGIDYLLAKNNTRLLPAMFSSLGRACSREKNYTHARAHQAGYLRISGPVGKIAIPSLRACVHTGECTCVVSVCVVLVILKNIYFLSK